MLDTSRLIEHWRSHGIECPPGATEAAIHEFETSRGLVLPADMRSYFLAVDGMGERGTCDNDFFSFWPIGDLISVAEDLPDRTAREPDAARYIMFADHSIALPTYAIRLSHRHSENTPVASVFADAGSFGLKVYFDSFTGFVNAYLDDPIETSVAIPDNV